LNCLRPEVLFSSSASPLGIDAGERDAGGHESYAYELHFNLEIEGNMTMLTQTRYYKSQDLSLKLTARDESAGWRFDVVGLKTDQDIPNFGIGEGPRRHQRYVLTSTRPSEKEKALIEEKILGLERIRGCQVRNKDSEKAGFSEGEKKKTYFNYYLWDSHNGGSMGFVMTPTGKTHSVSNQVELEVLSKPGGRKANPLFFDSLEYALAAFPPFSGEQVCARNQDGVVNWEMRGTPIFEGLIELSQHVYGRKMTLLEPERLEEQRITYQAHLVPGTAVVRVIGSMSRAEPTLVRVSGLKGHLWIESLHREVYLDIRETRILKDEVAISFGIERNKKVFPVSGVKNIVKVQLVDECFSGCQDTDSAILMAYGSCSPDSAPLSMTK